MMQSPDLFESHSPMTGPSPGTDDEREQEADQHLSESPPSPLSQSHPSRIRDPRPLSERLADLPRPLSYQSSHGVDGIANTSSELIKLASAIRDRLKTLESEQEAIDVC